MEEQTYCVKFCVYVCGVISSQYQDPGRHVARVLAGHQDSQLSARYTTEGDKSVTAAVSVPVPVLSGSIYT